MAAKRSVCLQINLAPSDVRYTDHTISHQMRVFADQVDEIQFTLDTTRRRTTRFSTEDFVERLSKLRAQVSHACSRYSHARPVEIDFSPEAIHEISTTLRTAGEIPINSYDGSPFYGYIFGLFNAKSDFVIHIDADMLFGGGSKSWIEEAVALLESDQRILAVNPLAGPPTRNGEIGQPYVERITAGYPAFTFRTISTRVFLVERERLFSDYTIPLLRVGGRRRLQAFINNMPATPQFEECLSALLVENECLRMDILGQGEGLWSLHPPYRSETFYARLPEIIRRIEAGDIPEGQRGDFDLNDAMIDWSDVRRKNGLASKLRRYSNYARHGIVERVLGR